MRAIGLDGFKNGWVAVLLDGDRRGISFYNSVGDALAGPFDRAAIDIPIGMNEDGQRCCDLLARNKLRPHTSRVFTGARRWLWQEFDDPDQANRAAQERGQKRVSRQLWHLGPKILEVDAFIRTNPAFDILETHPELVFLRLNDGRPLPSKRSEMGVKLRQKLLAEEGFADLADWLTHKRMGTGAKQDDVLDACAAAIAASKPTGSVPEGSPPLDAWGVPMQIWF